MKFIELTKKNDGKKILINSDQVTKISPVSDYTAITIPYEVLSIDVKESYEAVKEAIMTAETIVVALDN